MTTAQNEVSQPPAKPKRKLWKWTLLFLVLAATCGMGYTVLDAMGYFIPYDVYEYARTDGLEITRDDLAKLKKTFAARAEQVSPGGYGYGAPKLALRSGRLEVRMNPIQYNKNGMPYLMARGNYRVFDPAHESAIEPDDIVSAEAEPTMAGDRLINLHLTLTDEAVKRLQAEGWNARDTLKYLDGKKFADGYNPSSASVEGNAVIAARGEFVIRQLAAAINHPLHIDLVRLDREPSPSPASPALPTAIRSGLTRPTLAEGEQYYTATGKLEHTEEVMLGFVLSADRQVVRNVALSLRNLSVTTVAGNTRTVRNVGVANVTFNNSVPVKEGKARVFLGRNSSLELSGLDNGEITGKLTYSHTFHGTPTETIDLGSTTLAFKPDP